MKLLIGLWLREVRPRLLEGHMREKWLVFTAYWSYVLTWFVQVAAHLVKLHAWLLCN
uniref:Uncharacterized protein n=1 Tax=Coccidioides posadasii RMSCC 3488 TaxID=454284 RepID=A0A0J6FMR7_COCPO|nr:hypothetical protein CPAG_06496 [Coccidioides posadasii RMSCC 3488]